MPKIISLMPDESSILHHNVHDLPIAIYTIKLSDYLNKDFIMHWNDDVAFDIIRDGHITLDICGKSILLEENDLLMINSKVKHRMYSADNTDCTLTTILASPGVFVASDSAPSLWETFAPSGDPAYYILRNGSPDNKCIQELMNKIDELNGERPSMYNLQILGSLYILAAQYLSCISNNRGYFKRKEDPSRQVVDQMLDYIHLHYREQISLSEIAAAGGICRSQCCKLFRTYINCSPMEYVNDYRLSVSRNYLVDPSTSIASVAAICGFSTQSYYTRQFARKYGYTPKVFRSHNANEDTDG